MAVRASRPTSSSSWMAMSPSGRCAQPPTMRPSSQMVGPAFRRCRRCALDAGPGTTPGPPTPSSWRRARGAARPSARARHQARCRRAAPSPSDRRPGRPPRRGWQRGPPERRRPSSRSTSAGRRVCRVRRCAASDPPVGLARHPPPGRGSRRGASARWGSIAPGCPSMCRGAAHDRSARPRRATGTRAGPR